MTEMTAVSTFAGVGGFDLALERAGVRTVATVEIDKAARGVLTERWPDVHHYTDIKEVTADDLRAVGFVPEHGILTGGFPCQDLSVAGRRAGMGEGTRSGLFWELDRLMAELRPAWVVYENVPGLLSSVCPCTGDGACGSDECPYELHSVNGGACPGGCIAAHGGTMGSVLGALGNRGYGFAYRVLDAQHFGVPQRRRRVFIVGRLGDDGSAPAQVLAEFEGSVGDSAARPQAWQGLTGRAGRSVGEPSGRLLADTGVVRALSARQGESGIDLTDAEAGHLVSGFAVEPETGQGADLRAREVDKSPALAAKQSERGLHVVSTFRKAGRAQSADDDESWVEGDVANTVNTFDVGDTRATELVVSPINADALRGEGVAATPSADAEGKVRLRDPGFGVGKEGDPAGTLAAAGPGAVHVVAPIQDGRDMADKGQNGIGVGDEGEPSYTLDTTSRPGVAVSPAVTAKWAKGTGGPAGDEAQNLTRHGSTVRRLTPLECERLQGFPDGWTAVSNGNPQADGARYKQMGNALAVPVAEWIMLRLVAVETWLRGKA